MNPLGLEVCQHELWHLIETDTEIEMCVYVWVYTDMFQSPRNSDASVTASVSSAQIFVYKHHSPKKGTRTFWRSG